MNINFLKIPLYKLHYIEDVNEYQGLTKQGIESLKNTYDESELKGIVEAVRWAKQNPEYDFSSLLPDIRQNNKEIYKYICILESSLEDL